jgi:hypothetical protein
VQVALQSPVESPDTRVVTTELAFCLETIEVDVSDLKQRALESAPLLAMTWVYEALYSGTSDTSLLNVLRTYSDKDARKVLGAGLYLEHILFASERGSIDTESIRQIMWRRFIDAVSNNDQTSVLYPLPDTMVSFGIQKAIVHHRCGGKQVHFSETRLVNMTKDSETIPNRQVLNLEKDSFCDIVDDLNLMSGIDTRKAIVGCVNTLNTHHPSTLDLSDTEYWTMRKKTTTFLETVDAWEAAVDATDGGKALCGESRECQSRIQRLRMLAETSRTQAQTCQKEIKDFKKRSMQRDRTVKDGTKPRSLADRIRSWF